MIGGHFEVRTLLKLTNRVTSLVGHTLHPKSPSSSDNFPHDTRFPPTKAPSTSTTVGPVTAHPLHWKGALLQNKHPGAFHSFGAFTCLNFFFFLASSLGFRMKTMLLSTVITSGTPGPTGSGSEPTPPLFGDRGQQASGRAREASLPSSASNQSEVHVLVERANRE